jgi:DinB family protein
MGVSDRAIALADEFLARFVTLDQLIQSLSAAQWALPCGGEGWPVGYVAHHIGQGIVRPRGWIEQVLVGEEPFVFDWEVTHELNRRRSARLGLPPRDDTLRFLKVTAEHFAALVRSLSDEQLDRIGFAQRDARRDVAWVVRLVMRHVDEHRAGIVGALAAAGPREGQ